MNWIRILLFSFLIIIGPSVKGQGIEKPAFLNFDISDSLRNDIYASLDSLFLQIENERIDNRFIQTENSLLTISRLKILKGNSNKEDGDSLSLNKWNLINGYPISLNQYHLSIALMDSSENNEPRIKRIINLIAENKNSEIRFSLPLKYLTRYWNVETIGNIKYVYRGVLDKEIAKKFNIKNEIIANKLGVSPDKFIFYKCENYQEILMLLGIAYDLQSNGKTRDGYGVDSGFIFSVMNNEDFSHDVFHYYSGKVNETGQRNWLVEEGIAYSWGNAYYTDGNGKMIEQDLLIKELRNYLKENPETNLLSLFQKNLPIYKNLAPEISVRSAITSIICDEVERKKGIEGLMRFNNSKKENIIDDYFLATKELIGIDIENFNERVLKLIEEYDESETSNMDK